MRSALLICCGACLDQAAPTLPSDTYLTGIPRGFTSVEACEADNPFPNQACTHELALCANGRAGERTGDIVREGSYHLRGSHAIGTLDVMAFDLDLATNSAPGSNLGPITWVPDIERRWDTLQFDSIDCNQP
jgi:hypothetical protein